jgi:hypothetical protein
MSSENASQLGVEEDEDSPSVLQRVSASTLFGAFFSIPGLFLIEFFIPLSSATGYYLIGAAALISHVSLISLDSSREDADIDLSDLEAREKLAFMILMLIAVVIAVSTRLGIASVGAHYVSQASTEITGVLIAIGFPILERKMADSYPKFTPSVIVTLLFLYVLVYAVKLVSTLNSTSPEKVTKESMGLGFV